MTILCIQLSFFFVVVVKRRVLCVSSKPFYAFEKYSLFSPFATMNSYTQMNVKILFLFYNERVYKSTQTHTQNGKSLIESLIKTQRINWL